MKVQYQDKCGRAAPIISLKGINMKTSKITQEMVRDAVSDLSTYGKYYWLYQMLIDEVENQISDKKLTLIIHELNNSNVDCRKMSKLAILFEYTNLIQHEE